MCRILVQRHKDLFPIPEKDQQHSVMTFRSKGNSIKSSNSQRSKYLNSSKLIKSHLFLTIKGKRNQVHKENTEERDLQIQLLQDTLKLTEKEEQRVIQTLRCGLKNYKQDCRRVLRALQLDDC